MERPRRRSSASTSTGPCGDLGREGGVQRPQPLVRVVQLLGHGPHRERGHDAALGHGSQVPVLVDVRRVAAGCLPRHAGAVEERVGHGCTFAPAAGPVNRIGTGPVAPAAVRGCWATSGGREDPCSSRGRSVGRCTERRRPTHPCPCWSWRWSTRGAPRPRPCRERRTLARAAERLGYRRFWVAEHHNMAVRGQHHAAGAHGPPGGVDRAHPGRVRRGDAAQPRAAGRGRAVRAARGVAPGPHRPGHRPGTRAPTAATAAALRRTAEAAGRRGLPPRPARPHGAAGRPPARRPG